MTYALGNMQDQFCRMVAIYLSCGYPSYTHQSGDSRDKDSE
jgi:hypothetical protein